MVTARTVRAALATVEAADAAGTLTDLPDFLLPALIHLIGADSAVWTELDVIAGPGRVAPPVPRRVISFPEPLLTGETALAVEWHARDFPLIQHTRPGGDGWPIRRSDLQSTRSFRGSGLYADVARKLGIDEMLALALAPGSVHVCISLNRAGPDFTPAAVGLLTQLRPLLARRVARLTAGRAPPAPASPGPARLTARQQGVLRLVADGLTDTAIGHRLGCSPRTVDKHLEHIYRRLGVSGRTAAVAAARATSLPGHYRPGRPCPLSRARSGRR